MICPVWDDLIDLKIIDVMGFGRFEISVNYTDNTQTVKSVHGMSLEVELAQITIDLSVERIKCENNIAFFCDISSQEIIYGSPVNCISLQIFSIMICQKIW